MRFKFRWWLSRTCNSTMSFSHVIRTTVTNTCSVGKRFMSNKMKFRTALVQMHVGTDRTQNLQNAEKLIKNAKEEGAKLVCLPECFNSPYGAQYFEKYSESIPDGVTCKMLSKVAKDNGIYLVGGTIPEVADGNFYNTSTVWNPEGKLIAKFRKMHLFDIDIPNGITFKESDVLSAGDELAIFTMDDIKIGLGICYDLRFEELAKLYRLKGCRILIYPAAFNMHTGPKHFELLQRSRALDNQCFVMAISPATGEKGYIAWGHSQVTDPWGGVVSQATHKEEIVSCEIDMSCCDEVRQQIPIGDQRRKDLYDTIWKAK